MEIEELMEEYPDTLKMDGFDDCIIGISLRFGSPPHFAYSKSKIITKLMEGNDSESAYEEAEEYFEYNQLGAYVGEATPCFIEEIG